MQTLLQFSSIKPSEIETQLDKVLQDNREKLAALLKQDLFTWDNLITPLETLEDRLDQFWAPISHVNSVLNTEELRQAYNACLPKISNYATELGQNHALYLAYKSIYEQEAKNLSPIQLKALRDALRDFTLSGVALEPADKQRYQALQQELSQLSTKFEENILDTTQAWEYWTENESELQGLPTATLTAAKQAAQDQNKSGYVLTIDMPCYQAVISYADNRALRQKFYHAFTTRASEHNPLYDNSAVMQRILVLRLELAKLLGFSSYADYALSTKMAKSKSQVLDFLSQLATHIKPQALEELQELRAFAKKQGLDELAVWDLAYYSEKLKEAEYAISEEALRVYFPLPKVLSGLFKIIEILYGMTAEAVDTDRWHSDVLCYKIIDASNTLRGYVYLDLYARSKKRGGAWMDDGVTRRLLPTGEIQYPIAFLTCNFRAPLEAEPALLSHDEVVTLFHEFGHTLHHVLTQINIPELAGIHGVPWDAVEFPSQFFENWCWQAAGLDLISGHYQTGEPLPAALRTQLINAKHFHLGLYLLRQIEFALFDFQLHSEFDAKIDNQIQRVLNTVRQDLAIMPIPEFNRFQHSFAHIFAGGYAAAYYSYLWADVLASDAFSLFLEQGVLNPETGRRFLQLILEQGGSRDPETLFTEFRGRSPSIAPLLTQLNPNAALSTSD